MTLDEQLTQIDTLIPSGLTNGISSEDIRDAFKTIAAALYTRLAPTQLEFENLATTFTKTAVANMWVSATSEGDATAGTDSTLFIRNSVIAAAGRGVWFPAKDYRINQNVQLPDNCHISFAKGARIIVTANLPATNIGGNDTTYVFLAGNKCLIENAYIDGQGFNTGGILLLSKSDTTVRGCTVRNCIGTGFGIGVIAGQNNRVEGNTVLDCVHGINGFRSKSLHFLGNTTRRNFSGIYLVACTDSIIGYNIVDSNDDVGIDFEHCINCVAYCNLSSRSAQGEYAIFSGGAENADQGTQTGVIFRNNIAVRKATYCVSLDSSGNEITAACNALKGACDFASLMAGAVNCGFENNYLYVEFGYGVSHVQLTDKSSRSIFFRNNTVITKGGGKFHRTLDSDGLSFTGNTFVDKGGGEATQNELRDGHGLVYTDNSYTYEVAKTTAHAVTVNTNTTGWAVKAPVVARNKFYNCNNFALKIDLFQNGSLNPLLWNNYLGEDYTATGGLEITVWGGVRMRDQKIKLLLAASAGGTATLLTGITAIGRMGTGKGTGDLGFGRADYNGLYAQIMMIRGAGGGLNMRAISQITAPNLSVSDGGGNGTDTITLTNTTGGPVSGYLDLTLNTYP